mmetsp:Transcript_76321/g.205109  ORF Transcript_76321/g.205109 Transcript_76321/m.205109 type:complete len:186 (+) Transcript_76321:3510-4067(+)
MEAMAAELASKGPRELGMPDDWPDCHEFVQQWRNQLVHDRFQRTHNLRLPAWTAAGSAASAAVRQELPSCLSRALSKAGVVWAGAVALKGWSVEEAAGWSGAWPPVQWLVLRGEHDFVDRRCALDVGHKGAAEYVELTGLSHLAHLEAPSRYASALETFFRRVEASRSPPTPANPSPTWSKRHEL